MTVKRLAKTIKWRSSSELREMFLSYFEERGSRRYQSFPLVPDDPTLLFTVAGMVPFKPYFLGLKTPEVTRATTAQKCIRTNDIDNVGHTARHHTFFEMLGNFSFGDYFKKEVIPWAWEFITERIGLDPERLYATIYLDDDEAHDLWRDLVGLPEDRIIRFGDDDNFWAAGPTGPCGPCSELLYDQGPDFSCGKPDCGLGCSCDRYLEIWNLVFMQYSRDESGKLTPLPKKNIDTGMGLERLASIVQGVRGDFETDLFKPIMDRACGIAGFKYGDSPKGDLAVRVISDHLRASAFMIADGILPSNEGPGYVLRRLIRRSVRYGRLIGLDRPFLLELLPVVNEIMSGQYGELVEQSSTIRQILEMEETRFGRTLAQGMELLDDELKKVTETGGQGGTLPGEVAFILYDTYGFPLELTQEIASEANVSVGTEGFDAEMERQRERARASSKQSAAVISANIYTRLADKLGATRFDGYETTAAAAEVTAIISDGGEVDALSEGESGMIILSNTPFYAERGGQAGDRGILECDGARFDVEDAVYPSGDMVAHAGKVSKGVIKTGMKLEAIVDSVRRDATRRHHTATHLLHEALIRVLGKHVRQAGSLVAPTFLRFDFNHFGPLSEDEIREAERIVYRQVLRAVPVRTSVMNYDEARKLGVKALFEEKYGDVVRVLEVPGFSTELCGGTHVSNTGEIGLVKILKDEGIGSGVRRVVASAGEASFDLATEAFKTLRDISGVLGVSGEDAESLVTKAEGLITEKKLLERKNQDLLLESASSGVSERLKDAVKIGGVTLVVDRFDNTPKDLLRQVGDRIKQLEPNAVILFAGVENDSVTLVGMAADSAVKSGVHAGNLVKETAALIGGSGGGKPASGQGGGKDPSRLEEALSAAARIVAAQLEK
ncbi:MAG: alanine--tRNA ligase [Synergistaceae bacterium]|jgi:alanyl-tRNA synthetase|nr:alanine--tRNA ligase [Synergistaceae bacterium]